MLEYARPRPREGGDFLNYIESPNGIPASDHVGGAFTGTGVLINAFAGTESKKMSVYLQWHKIDTTAIRLPGKFKCMNNFTWVEQGGIRWILASEAQKIFPADFLEKLVPGYRPPGNEVVQKRKGHVSWVEGTGETFIKKYYPRNLLNRVQYSFRTNRAQREFSSSNTLRKLEVPVPDLLAYGQFRQLGTWQCSYLVYRYYPLHTNLRDIDWSTRQAGNLVLPLAREIAGMHDNGIYFGDLHAGNIMTCSSEEGLPLLFTDFDKTRIMKNLPENLLVDDLARLNGFIDSTIEQRMEFLFHYCRIRRISAVRDLFIKLNQRTEQLWSMRYQRLGTDERKYPRVEP